MHLRPRFRQLRNRGRRLAASTPALPVPQPAVPACLVTRCYDDVPPAPTPLSPLEQLALLALLAAYQHVLLEEVEREFEQLPPDARRAALGALARVASRNDPWELDG